MPSVFFSQPVRPIRALSTRLRIRVSGRGEINRDIAGRHAEITRTARHMGDACRFAQRLGRRAAGVDTGTAHQVALDHRDLFAAPGQRHRQ